MMSKYRQFIFAMLLMSFLGTGVLFAQAGGSSVPFLRIAPDARSSGMGETGVAIADDANAVYWNPAGLGFLDYFRKGDEFVDPEPYRQVMLSFSPWLPQFNADLFYSYGIYAQHIEDVGTIAVNLMFMNLGEFTRTTQNGRVLGTFTSNEFAVGAYYGTTITEDLGIGAGLKYIRSNLTPATQTSQAGSGNSVALDLGLLWKPQDLWIFKDNFSAGFNLQNLGPKITYISESDPLPTNLKLGVAYRVFKDEFNDLKLAIDVQKLLVKRDSAGGSDPVPVSLYTAWENPGMEFSIGTEYWYEQVIAIRAGYFTEPSSLGGRQFWNLGASVRYKIFRLDFGYILTVEENHPLANTMRFSLLIDWR